MNTVNTKVDVRFKLAEADWIPEKTRQKLLNGVSRSQHTISCKVFSIRAVKFLSLTVTNVLDFSKLYNHYNVMDLGASTWERCNSYTLHDKGSVCD